jgi:hypothetical protein
MMQKRKETGTSAGDFQPGTDPVSPAADVASMRGAQSEAIDRPADGAGAAEGMSGAFAAMPLENLLNAQRAQSEGFMQAVHTFLLGMTALQREALDFGDRRARAILDGPKGAPETIVDWNGMLSQQIDYANRATREYLDEATKLVELGVKVSQESWTPLQDSLATSFNEMFRKAE